jgi:hypothetical protein
LGYKRDEKVLNLLKIYQMYFKSVITTPEIEQLPMILCIFLLQDYHSRNAVREQNGLQPILDLTKSEFAIIQELALVALARAAQDGESKTAFVIQAKSAI